MCQVSDAPRYVPWLLNETRGFPWGIKDTHTGVNVLGDFLPVASGAVMAWSEKAAAALVASGRKREWSQAVGVSAPGE